VHKTKITNKNQYAGERNRVEWRTASLGACGYQFHIIYYSDTTHR